MTATAIQKNANRLIRYKGEIYRLLGTVMKSGSRWAMLASMSRETKTKSIHSFVNPTLLNSSMLLPKDKFVLDLERSTAKGKLRKKLEEMKKRLSWVDFDDQTATERQLANDVMHALQYLKQL